jgi:hypothetical protein
MTVGWHFQLDALKWSRPIKDVSGTLLGVCEQPHPPPSIFSTTSARSRRAAKLPLAFSEGLSGRVSASPMVQLSSVVVAPIQRQLDVNIAWQKAHQELSVFDNHRFQSTISKPHHQLRE